MKLLTKTLVIALSLSQALSVTAMAESTEQKPVDQAVDQAVQNAKKWTAEKIEVLKKDALNAITSGSADREKILKDVQARIQELNVQERLALLSDIEKDLNNSLSDKSSAIISNRDAGMAVGALLALGVVHTAHRAGKNGKALTLSVLAVGVLGAFAADNDPELRVKLEDVLVQLRQLKDATVSEVKALAL